MKKMFGLFFDKTVNQFNEYINKKTFDEDKSHKK